MDKHTLYVDVTQLVHWEGKLTGIPRVMYELAVRLHDNPNVVYVSWVRQVKKYCEIDFTQSVLKRGGIKYLQQQDGDSDASMANADATQNTVRDYVRRGLNKAINSTKYIRPEMPDRIRDEVVRKKADNYRQIMPGKGDSVFIPWGEWWDKNFLAMIVSSQKNGAKISTFIHDVGPMVAPHITGNSASLADYCATVVPICDAVFVNSKFTRDTLKTWLEKYGHSVPEITVVTLGDDFKHSEPKRPQAEEFKQAHLSGADYILTVGTVELKKNHIFYYYVYKLAAERGIDLPPLVIAGRRGWGTEMNINIMQTDPEVKDKFIFLFDTSDEELAWLYEHTLYSVFASMYEGWGLPLSESLFHGVPVVSARSTSLVEIGDGIIDRFTQYSTDECLSCMQRMLGTEYLENKRATIKDKYRPATWDQCYQAIAENLRKKEMLSHA